jgi:predicted transcriptional regulator
MKMESRVINVLKERDANALEIADTIGGDVTEVLPVLRRLKTQGLLVEVE